MSQPNENAPRCPVCGKTQTGQSRPFCSKRCADVDLGRWLKGSYVIPGRAADEGEGPQTPVTPEAADGE